MIESRCRRRKRSSCAEGRRLVTGPEYTEFEVGGKQIRRLKPYFMAVSDRRAVSTGFTQLNSVGRYHPHSLRSINILYARLWGFYLKYWGKTIFNVTSYNCDFRIRST